MRSRSASSINSKSPENAAIEKISSLITRFHAVLLPKANGSGVFRDLSEEQQYLLNNIDSDNPLHSILAGCLAIDSCLSSIAQAEQNLTDNILKSLTNLCKVWQKAQNELIESVEAKNLSLAKIEQICKKMQESNINLLRYCQQLPFSEQNEQVKKQQKILSQQDITFKISSMKLFEDKSDQQILKSNTNINMNIKELEQQNRKLQDKLSYTQKKVIELQLKLTKLQDVNKSSPKTYQTQKQKNPRKYSQNQKYQQQVDIDKTSNWPLFNSPSSCSLMHQKEVQSLKEQIITYQRKIFQLQQEFKKERKKLIYQIRMLEEQLQENDVNQDRQLILLLQELEEEIQNLREERRQDERIIGQVQQKLEGMSISRQSRILRGIKARQSRLGIRYSNVFNQGQNQMDNSRSPSYKKSRIRDRLYTKIDEVSRSSISMPKMKDYSISDYQKQKMGWRTDQARPIRNNDRFGYRNYEEPEVRYSYIVDKNPSTIGRRTSKQDNYNKPETHYRTQRSSNLNKITLVQSKHPRQSILIKPQQQQLSINQKIRIKEYEDNHNYRQHRYNGPIQNQTKGKVTKWKQIVSNNKYQGNQRLKTSRI